MSEVSLYAPASADAQLLGIEVGGLAARRPKPKRISSRGSRKGLRAECYGTEMLRTYFTFEPSAREVN